MIGVQHSDYLHGGVFIYRDGLNLVYPAGGRNLYCRLCPKPREPVGLVPPMVGGPRGLSRGDRVILLWDKLLCSEGDGRLEIEHVDWSSVGVQLNHPFEYRGAQLNREVQTFSISMPPMEMRSHREGQSNFLVYALVILYTAYAISRLFRSR